MSSIVLSTGATLAAGAGDGAAGAVDATCSLTGSATGAGDGVITTFGTFDSCFATCTS